MYFFHTENTVICVCTLYLNDFTSTVSVLKTFIFYTLLAEVSIKMLQIKVSIQ